MILASCSVSLGGDFYSTASAGVPSIVGAARLRPPAPYGSVHGIGWHVNNWAHSAAALRNDS